MNKYRIRRVSYKLSSKAIDHSSNNDSALKNLIRRVKPKKVKSKGRGFLKLANLYVLGFLVTYTFSYVSEYE